MLKKLKLGLNHITQLLGMGSQLKMTETEIKLLDGLLAKFALSTSSEQILIKLTNYSVGLGTHHNITIEGVDAFDCIQIANEHWVIQLLLPGKMTDERREELSFKFAAVLEEFQ